MVAEVCAWILARQKVIDRPISRAERMALVLRITRFNSQTCGMRAGIPVRRAVLYLAQGPQLSPVSVMRTPGS